MSTQHEWIPTELVRPPHGVRVDVLRVMGTGRARIACRILVGLGMSFAGIDYWRYSGGGS